MFISDIVDRYSILLLKQERTDLDLEKELDLYKKRLFKYKNISIFTDMLYDINGKIWDLESDIRMGKEGELGLEEVGRRAIKIRNLNNKRVSIKNEIVKQYDEGFEEKKVNHASE